MKLKRVSKAEYKDFLDNYPRILEVDVCGIIEPPVVNHYDLTLGNIPYSCVAKTFKYDSDGPFCVPENERVYYILDRDDA